MTSKPILDPIYDQNTYHQLIFWPDLMILLYTGAEWPVQYGPCILRLFKFAEFKTFIVLNWPEYYQMLMIDDPGKYLMLFGPLRP